MATKTKLKQITTPAEKLQDAFKKYADNVGEILDDYVVGNDGLFTELASAEEDFKDRIDELVPEAVTVESIKEQLDEEEIEVNDLLALIDTGDIADYLEAEGYVIIKVEGMMDREKLRQFISQNIYPYCVNPEKQENLF